VYIEFEFIMAVEFNPKRYEDAFIADLVGFVAADEFQNMFEQFFLTFAVEFSGINYIFILV